MVDYLKDAHFVWSEALQLKASAMPATRAYDPPKRNNPINIFLIDLNIYHAFLLNIYEYLKYHQHQYYHNQLENYTHTCSPVFFVLSTITTFEILLKHGIHLFQNLLL